MSYSFTNKLPASLPPLLLPMIEAVQPEKIFLLSAIAQRQQVQSIFCDHCFETENLHAVWLLVLLPESSKHQLYELQDKIEDLCAFSLSVTAIAISLKQFNAWLENAHPFACKVLDAGLICYDNGNSRLQQAAACDMDLRKQEAAQQLNRHCQLATEFASGAELFILRKSYNMAAFHLHQAAEQAYAGIIHFVSGWRVQTHSLDRLHRYAQFLLPGVYELFPRHTAAEKQLFQYLQKAYADTRYKNDYSIRYPELLVLQQRVKKLLSLCQKLNHSIPIIS